MGSFYHYQPVTDTQRVFYSESISQLNELGRQRRLRLMYGNAEIHYSLWLFLLGGGFITIGFTFLVGARNGKIKVLVTTLLSSLIMSSIYLVYTFQHPFEGVVSIKPEPYLLLKSSFESRDR